MSASSYMIIHHLYASLSDFMCIQYQQFVHIVAVILRAAITSAWQDSDDKVACTLPTVPTAEPSKWQVGLSQRYQICHLGPSPVASPNLALMRDRKQQVLTASQVISPDFPLELTEFFPGKHLIHFLVLRMKDFRNFVVHNCILVFDSEHVD